MSEFYYETKGFNGNVGSCIDADEYYKFFDEIMSDQSLNHSDRDLLLLLATRFIVFKYEKLADYYAVAPKNVADWLEKLRCVVVDHDSAIKNGYFKYFEGYSDLIKEVVNEE